ncbi:MAG: phosphatase PAP2 family protein [Burkholderiaceae bacterium]
MRPTLAELLKRPLVLWLASLGLAIAWDLGAQDMPVMHLLGTVRGFALRDEPLLSLGLHDGFRQLALALLAALVLWTFWPGPSARAQRRERLAVLGAVLVSILAVNLIKINSLTSCPWDLADFGGRAHHVSHWSWGIADGGRGHCFPGGHASSAFAFVGLALPGLTRGQRSGWWWLAAVLLMGVVAGAVQTLRGAHYPSHTLWTLVVCLGSAVLVWGVVMRGARMPARA